MYTVSRRAILCHYSYLFYTPNNIGLHSSESGEEYPLVCGVVSRNVLYGPSKSGDESPLDRGAGPSDSSLQLRDPSLCGASSPSSTAHPFGFRHVAPGWHIALHGRSAVTQAQPAHLLTLLASRAVGATWASLSPFPVRGDVDVVRLREAVPS